MKNLKLKENIQRTIIACSFGLWLHSSTVKVIENTFNAQEQVLSIKVNENEENEIDTFSLGKDYTIDFSESGNISEEHKMQIVKFIEKELSVYPSAIKRKKLVFKITNDYYIQDSAIGLTVYELRKSYEDDTEILLSLYHMEAWIIHHEMGHYLDVGNKYPNSDDSSHILLEAGQTEEDHYDFLNDYSKINHKEQIAVLHQFLFGDIEKYINILKDNEVFVKQLEAYVCAEVNRNALQEGKLKFNKVYTEKEYLKLFGGSYNILFGKYKNDIDGYLDYLNNIQLFNQYKGKDKSKD